MLSALLCGAGGLLVLYWLLSTCFVGTVGFTNLLCGVGILLILLGVLERRFGGNPAVLRVKKVLLPLAAAGIAGFLVLEGLILAGAARKDEAPADYILVLGAGLRGEEMSLTLLMRMETAVACEQGEVIAVSGGQGRNEDIPEAEAMGDYLLSQGIPADRILREDQSTSTMENLVYSRALIEADSGKDISELRVKIVTSDFHCCRALMLARRAGYTQASGYGAPTPGWVMPSSCIREAFALVKSFLLDR